jgi:hypothetical protein
LHHLRAVEVQEAILEDQNPEAKRNIEYPCKDSERQQGRSNASGTSIDPSQGIKHGRKGGRIHFLKTRYGQALYIRKFEEESPQE